MMEEAPSGSIVVKNEREEIQHYHNTIYYESHRTVESHKKFVYRPLPQTSTTAPTYFCMFTILVLNSQSTFNCNCYKEPDWLFKIRIVNMQNYVGAVVDVCGNGRYTNFLCDSTIR